MKILGIETSCDETAAAVVEDGTHVLSNIVHSQIEIHKQYGGVVPEVAARSHIEMINPVIQRALDEAKITWHDVNALGVTFGPGLLGSLLIGTLAARTYALTKNIPLYPIHHVTAHVYAALLSDTASSPAFSFPLLSLIVSGGHTQVVLFFSHEKYRILGQTQDDAVGEAFDKVAKMLGLPYPGGPAIAHAAQKGDPYRYNLPIARMKNPYDFSFSGLKTAVLRAIQKEVGVDHTFPSFELSERLTASQRYDFAASFQYTAIKTLLQATKKACDEYNPRTCVLAGGVAANTLLRDELQQHLPVPVLLPALPYCTDNAAMIAGLAYYQSRHAEAIDPYKLEAVPTISM